MTPEQQRREEMHEYMLHIIEDRLSKSWSEFVHALLCLKKWEDPSILYGLEYVEIDYSNAFCPLGVVALFGSLIIPG